MDEGGNEIGSLSDDAEPIEGSSDFRLEFRMVEAENLFGHTGPGKELKDAVGGIFLFGEFGLQRSLLVLQRIQHSVYERSGLLVGKFLRQFDGLVDGHSLGNLVAFEIKHLVSGNENGQQVHYRHHVDVEFRSVFPNDRGKLAFADDDSGKGFQKIRVGTEMRKPFVEVRFQKGGQFEAVSENASRVECLQQAFSRFVTARFFHGIGKRKELGAKAPVRQGVEKRGRQEPTPSGIRPEPW